YFNRLKSITNINVISVVGFIQGQQEFYKSFFEKKNISHLILASKSWESAKNSSYSAYVDTFRAVLFILFYNYKSVNPIEKFDGVYEELLNKTDLSNIDPPSTLQEKLQSLGIQSDYTFEKENMSFTCIITVKFSNSTFEFNAIGKSKKEAKK